MKTMHHYLHNIIHMHLVGVGQPEFKVTVDAFKHSNDVNHDSIASFGSERKFN